MSVNFSLDNRDRINTLVALVAFWEAKCETDFEENSREFAEAIKERIINQSKAVEDMRAKRLPSPEKLSIHLYPKNDEIGRMLSQAGYNPKLQITKKSKKPIGYIIKYLKKKWVDENDKFISHFPVRLYPQGMNSVHHRGYGIEDQDTTILAIYHSMGCPSICKFEYMWGDETVIHSDSSLQGELGDAYDPFHTHSGPYKFEEDEESEYYTKQEDLDQPNYLELPTDISLSDLDTSTDLYGYSKQGLKLLQSPETSDNFGHGFTYSNENSQSLFNNGEASFPYLMKGNFLGDNSSLASDDFGSGQRHNDLEQFESSTSFVPFNNNSSLRATK